MASRDTDAVDEFNTMVAMLRQRLPGRAVESGFLEFARPTIGEGYEENWPPAARGSIMALPSDAVRRHPCEERSALGGEQFPTPPTPMWRSPSAAISSVELKLLRRRVCAHRGGRNRPRPKRSPARIRCLLVVGRGTNDPDANSNIAKIARMLWEGMGFGWAESAFSGVAGAAGRCGARQGGEARLRPHHRLPVFSVPPACW